MFKYFGLSIVVASMVSVAGLDALAPPDLSQYRDITLGDSVANVVQRLQLATSDVKVRFERPELVQEATWRPHRFVSGSAVSADPLGEMVLTFHLDRLARIVVTYDRDRTQGLTDADLLESLTGVYGTPVLPTSHVPFPTNPPSPVPFLTNPLSPRVVIGTWADSDAQLLLWRDQYPRLVGLTIVGTAREARLQAALVEGARLYAAGGPARERDQHAAAAAAIEQREARTRLENKARFKP